MAFNEIGIFNFRIFKEETDFQLNPITVLTGTNSSGKSSFFKALLLLADNIKKSKLQKLEFNSPLHKLGTFQSVINHDTEEDYLYFKLKYQFNDNPNLRSPYLLNDILDYYFVYEKGRGEGGTLKQLFCMDNDVVIFSYYPKIEDTAFLSINYKWIWEKLQVKFQSYKKLRNEEKVAPKGKVKLVKKRNDMLMRALLFGEFTDYFDLFYLLEPSLIDLEKVKLYFQGTEKELQEFQTYLENSILDQLSVKAGFSEEYSRRYPGPEFDIPFNNVMDVFNAYSEEILKSLKENKDDFEGSINQWDLSLIKGEQTEKIHVKPEFWSLKLVEIIKPEFFQIFKNIIKPNIDWLLQRPFYFDLNYIQAVRATMQRLYGSDSLGGEFSKLLEQIRNNPFGQFKIEFINKWLKEFGIGDEFRIEGIEGASSKISIVKNEREIPLADVGYGVTQLLPIIIGIPYYHDQFSDITLSREILLIEEPESNLHPALQSKLADFFVDAITKFDVKILVETHSEYFIRKLQYLTLKKGIKPEDSIIYYFYPPDDVPKNEKQIKEIKIKEDGTLSDKFGSGFFDEADNIAIELFNLSKNNKN